MKPPKLRPDWIRCIVALWPLKFIELAEAILGVLTLGLYYPPWSIRYLFALTIYETKHPDVFWLKHLKKKKEN